MTTPTMASGLACPVPLAQADRVQLGHGSGGKMSAALLRDLFLLHVGNETLSKLADAAVVPVEGGEIAVSTDSFVVSPLEFPGGTIGSLAVHGTLNDLAMMGAIPRYLSSAFILEEGLPFEVLERVVADMARAARAAGVPIITGDTKVVERGKADGLYVNTTGIGVLDPVLRPRPDAVRPGDLLVVSGPLAQHGMVVSGRSEADGLVEMIELPEHPWFLGCQFHPEFTSNPRDGHALFRGFVEAARAYRATRTAMAVAS